MRQPLGIISGASALLVLVSTARNARAGGVSHREEHVFRAVNDLPNALHGPLWAVMQSGSLAAVFVAAGAQARRQPPARTAAVLLAGVGVWGGVKLVKPLVGRGRPSAELDHVVVRGHAQSGLGYPSGHSAVAATLAIALSHDRGVMAGACALGVATLTGGARMYVGAHLPLDIAGGLAIGALGGGLAMYALDGLGDRA
jgi:membrane-associated phospholipid phosphatase